MSEKGTKLAIRTEQDLKMPISEQQRIRLQALASMPDEAVDTVDIPVASPEVWNTARRGRALFGQHKEAISLHIDADVLDWYKSTGEDWQTRINNVLAEHYLGELSKARHSHNG